MDGDKWVAALGAPPPMPPTPAEEAARQARVKEAIREMLGVRADAPVPPPDGMGIEDYLAEYRVPE